MAGVLVPLLLVDDDDEADEDDDGATVEFTNDRLLR